MAKSKKDTTEEIDLIAKLTSEYGDVFVSGADFADAPKIVIPVSPKIDMALGGGVPEGSMFILNGDPKVGKTVTSLQFCANAQKPEYGSRKVYFMNIEGRLKARDLKGIHGLEYRDPTKFQVIGSTEDKILSAQDYLSIAERILLTEKNIVMVFDSFSALSHEKELTEGIGTALRAAGQALLKQFCRQMGQVLPVKNHIIIGITHNMANVTGYGAAKLEQGGYGLAYQVDVKLQCKRTELWETASGKPIGKKVTWMVLSSALTGFAGQELVSYIRFGYGIDDIQEAIDMAVDLDIIDKRAAWFALPFVEKYPEVLDGREYVEAEWKAQGMDKLYTMFIENHKLLDAMKRELSESYGN